MSTDRGETDVKVFAPSAVGQHIRRIGEDIKAGTQLFRMGDHLGPRDIGVLAGIGLDKVLVRPRPRVVVISTGSNSSSRVSRSATSSRSSIRTPTCSRLPPSHRRPGLPSRTGE